MVKQKINGGSAKYSPLPNFFGGVDPTNISSPNEIPANVSNPNKILCKWALGDQLNCRPSISRSGAKWGWGVLYPAKLSIPKLFMFKIFVEGVGSIL